MSEAAPLTTTLSEAGRLPVALVGGKARSLGVLLDASLPAIEGIVFTTAAFRAFVAENGLSERVALELARRPLDDLRDEELWDASTRIRSAFQAAPWPPSLREELARCIAPLVSAGPLVVRSSSPQEDSDERAFAGLHDSVIGVEGLEAALAAAATVWSSLYSERALMYRAELGLDVACAAMAVVVQPLATSERSGITFTVSPVAPGVGEIEAVWGLGEGLVSGRVEPDHWTMDRRSGAIRAHVSGPRDQTMTLSDARLELEVISDRRRCSAPLERDEVDAVWALALSAEERFGAPQDCEWTYDRGRQVLVQSRPITTLPPDARASWSRAEQSEERLIALGRRIEDELLPAMAQETQALREVDLTVLEDSALTIEAETRREAVERWREIYRADFIPLAHGIRVFGRYYNDHLGPRDPFEFIGLLVRTPAEYAQHTRLLAEVGVEPPAAPPVEARAALEARFLEAVGAEEREHAARVLSLGRDSWRLRDDDNLYLRALEQEAERVLAEIVARRTRQGGDFRVRDALARAESGLVGLDATSVDSSRPEPLVAEPGVTPRQLLGQSAAPGVGHGIARVARTADEVRELGRGEVLVVDALEPDTAAFAARAAAIVERRGGMLVHGAIVAREHGVPAVTGVIDATNVIRTGQRLTVDGFLGIVVLDDV
jgi:pyruvate,water dikinase